MEWRLVSSNNQDAVARRPRVLLVDDHPEVFDGLRRLLEPKFEVVATAQSGEEMLTMARQEQPDLLVVDISMPKISGIEATRRLRKENSQAKIVFLTMHQDAALIQQGLAVGALGYVLKVFARTDLVQALQQALRGEQFVSPALQKRPL
jgi:DNA-binding NarL/FixJ family response regulator